MEFNGGVNVHYVIIGASAAGISAAKTLRRLDARSEITIISKEQDVGYSRCLSTYYISGRIPRNKIYICSSDEIANLNARILTGIEAVEVDASSKIVRLSDNNVVIFDKLLVASGASPIIPEIPGLSGQGVHTLRTLGDAEAILSGLSYVRSAVVLGDGLVSITTAAALNSKGVKVSIVGIAPHILATFLDETAARLLQDKLTEIGIDLYLGQSCKEIHRTMSGGLEGVTITDGRKIDAEMVIIAAGVRPNTDFLPNTVISAGPGVQVNEYLETELPEIYAAGDVARCYDFVRNSSWWHPLWPNAVEQGQLAAYNMAGVRRPYQGCTNMNSLNIGGIPVICVGAANQDQPGQETFVLSRSNSTYEKLVFQGDKLVGFILLGKTEKAGVLTSLVFQAAVSPTQKEKLLNGNFSYAAATGLASLKI